MHKKHIHTKKGFTLLELLVAVSLMLVITGAIVIVFQNSTRIFNLSEANINVFQNARAAFDTIAKELASARNDGTSPVTIRPVSNQASQALLSFRTIVNFEDAGGNSLSGFVDVTYNLVKVNGKNVWRLQRSFTNPATSVANNDILCQFVTTEADGEPAIQFSFATFDSATPQWNLVLGPRGNPADPPLQDINADALRMDINMTDIQGRVERTFSRVFWIAN